MAIWPEAHTVEQQIFLLCMYGFFIFTGSKMLAEGSDILRDIYGAGIVGGIVIPIIGAIPDGLIVLFSGIKPGTHDEIQQQLNVGIGALAGATIMLITVPLCVAVFIGSRQLDEEGRAMSEYRPVAIGSNKLILKPVVPVRFSLFANGATALPSTSKGAKWMIFTCITFLIIQIPAFFYRNDPDGGAAHESIYALIGCVVSLIFFFAYLYAMWGDADNIDLIEERRQRVHKFMMWSQENRSLIGTLDPITLFNLLDKDKDSLLDVEDIRLGFKTMGLELSHPEAQSFFNMMDVDGNDAVDIAEFVSFVREFILASETTNPAPPVGGVSAAAGTNSTLTPNGSININSTSGLPLGSINSTSHTSHFSGMNGNVNISMNHGYYPNESSGRSIAGSIISTSSATPGMQAIKERILREERVRSHSRSRRSSVTSLDRDRILAAAASTSTLTPVSKQDNKSVNAILSMNSHLQSGTPSHRGRSINRNTNTRVNTSQNNIENAPLLHTNADHVDDDLENGGDAGVTTKSLYDQSQQSQTSQTAESHGLLTGINTIKQNGSIISQNGKSIQSYGSTGSIAAETEAETGVEGGPPTLVRQPSYSSQSTFIQAKAHPFGSTQANLYNNPNMTISSNIAYMQSQVQSGINNPNITPGMSTDQMPMQMHLNPEKLNMLNAMGISGTIPGMGNIPHNIPNIPNVHSMPNMSNTHTIPTINPQQPETVIDLYTDPNRREEALEKNSMVPPLPPELMGIIIEWICDQNRTESVLIRVGTKHRWALHLWAARTGKLLHFSTTDPYTNERVLKLSKLPQCFTQVRENKSGNVSGNVSGIATPGLMSMSSNGGIITNNMNINQSNNPRSSTTSRTYPYQNSNNEYPYQIDSNSNPAFDRVWTETDLPRWASASNKITNFVRQHPGCTIQTVFAEADTDKRGSVTLANLISFCARFDIDIPAHAVKIFFYTNDADHDRALAIQDFKHFLESLVRVPEELEEVDRLMREVEDETLEHDLAMAGLSTYIDPAHAHMQGWSEKRKKMYGIGLLLFGISIVAFFSDPMIEVIGAFSVNINVKPFYVSFVVTPFVSNASEVIASLMFARAKTNVSMGLTLSSLYGAVTMNNTLCMCIFLAIITTRGLAWRYTAEVLTIITIECIVASIVMRETLRQWQAVIIGSLFPLSILMVYVLEVWGVNG